MKFTPEVTAALAVLREHAENDFERHRIDVLERDLTNPPTVEIVDDRKQIFDGLNYYIVKKGHFRSSQYIHQAVWIYHRGEIPAGCDIHHIDGDKANNTIGNLQCITHAEHRNIHNNTRGKKIFVCEACGREYEAFDNSRNKFCSPQCANFIRNQRQEKEVTCVTCGQKFYSRRPNVQFCSHKCAGVTQSKPQIKKTCPVCGNTFTPPRKHKNQTYCSKICANKARRNNNY